ERTAERRRERKIISERQQLAREVHDEVGQALSGLLVQIRLAKARGFAGEAELQVLERAARNAGDGARALAYGLRHLDRGVGPLEHARSFSETLLRAAGCTLSWAEERTDDRVAGKTLREIGRVVKESITNVVRHANAKTVRVRLEYPDGLIRVTIRDDGIGFTPHDVRPTRDGRGLGPPALFALIDGSTWGMRTLLLLDADDDPSIFADAISAHPQGYLSRRASRATLEAAIAEVYRSGSYLDPLLMDSVLNAAPALLSVRERQILVRIASGLSTKEVARECAITPKTVANHVNNMVQKLHFR